MQILSHAVRGIPAIKDLPVAMFERLVVPSKISVQILSASNAFPEMLDTSVDQVNGHVHDLALTISRIITNV